MKHVLRHAALILLAAAPLFAQPIAQPAPGELPAGPHPWRVWEAEAKAAVAERALAAPALKSHPAQDLYDVHHYDLDLDLDVTVTLLTGTVTMGATVTGSAMRQVVLDLDALLAVDAVRVDGVAASWTHEQDLLTVELARDYAAGEMISVAVDYHGDPEDAGDAFGWDFVNARRLVWTLSEPYGARTWWPCKDVNSDKADSLDMRVEVPAEMTVAGNGVLVSDETVGDRRTFHWHERHPICTYLVSLTAYPYVVYEDTYVAGDGTTMPITNFVVPEYEQEARDGYAVTADIIAAFAEGYGEYPFLDEKYGHAHFNWGGGMEHQTCSSMLYWYFGSGLIAHELSHQWWGDLVTCADFRDIWLNEGFATWSEAYWREKSEGIAGYRAEMADAEYLGPGTIYVEDPQDFGAIFSHDLSYNKASWVVHMLRGVLGDDDFFAALALYRERFAYGSATTADLQAAMQDVSGRDLEAFFQQWIYGEYYPRYLFTYVLTPLEGETRVQLRIEQLQNETGVFVMPIRVRVTTADGPVWQVVENDRRIQNYTFTVPGEASLVEVDPEKWILGQVLGGSTVDVPAAAGALAISAHPNPFNPRTTVRLELPAAGRVRLDLYDAAGRHVRRLLDEVVPAGRRDVRWDGSDDAGRPAATGVYFAVVDGAAGRGTTPLTLVR